MRKRILAIVVTAMLVITCCWPVFAWATDEVVADDGTVIVEEDDSSDGLRLSSDNTAALIEGCSFALNDFQRASAGSNQLIDDEYYGYTYYIGKKPSDVMYIATGDAVIVYVDRAKAASLGLDISDAQDQAQLRELVETLGKANENGNRGIAKDATWHFTDEEAIEVDGVAYSFNRLLPNDRRYNCVIGKDGGDITDTANEHYTLLTHCCFAELTAPDGAAIAPEPTFGEKMEAFFANLDWSPLWVTLKTTLTAIVFIFILGLAAAYLTLHVSPRVRDLLDTVFTIPMVLPPTVCGFLLLLLLGSKTPIGQWFNSIGFPLVFSWPATVIAAVVVAFPLMYRNARGAFENLDPNMLDAARTLGWKESKIFFKLMLPLSWSSIAAGTVLAFARALGEYGATLFLAGNYAGITRTIPISIYFYWKTGHTDIAIFWTIVVLVFSFVVILFINLWSQHTTRYRKREAGE